VDRIPRLPFLGNVPFKRTLSLFLLFDCLVSIFFTLSLIPEYSYPFFISFNKNIVQHKYMINESIEVKVVIFLNSKNPQ